MTEIEQKKLQFEPPPADIWTGMQEIAVAKLLMAFYTADQLPHHTLLYTDYNSTMLNYSPRELEAGTLCVRSKKPTDVELWEVTDADGVPAWIERGKA
jgi:hypothetical protein